jgi:hypothetical protein
MDMKKKLFIFVVTAIFPIANIFAQCAQTANIYSFSYGGHNYEIVKELKNWTDAAACAVERGGYLVRIDNAAENAQIMTSITAAGISASYHPVTDGGGASYIWTGGSDKNNEGTWLWDGDNNNVGTNFYTGQGTAGSGGGVAVGGAYVNWGCSSGMCEPDNYFYLHDQDALGFALNSWPYGSASQWNDIDNTNTLYFIIENDGTPPPCTTPSSLSAFNISNTTAKIRWTSTAANFSVRYKTSVASNWTTVASSNDTLALTALTANTTYNFQVKAICSSAPSDTSSWSAVANFTTLNNIGVQEKKSNEITIFPNPADNYIQIEGIGDLKATIKILNLDGKMLKEVDLSEIPEGRINIKNLPEGIYFVKINSKNHQYTLRFVKK